MGRQCLSTNLPSNYKGYTEIMTKAVQSHKKIAIVTGSSKGIG